MGKKIEMIGQKFGKLKVLSGAGVSDYGKLLYNCECECGGASITTGNNLRSGNSKSCGCVVTPPNWDTSVDARGTAAWANAILGTGRSSAKRCGHAPPIGTIDEVQLLWQQSNGYCDITGRPFSKENPPCLDHDHTNWETYNLRGFIGRHVNLALGMLEDDVSLFAAAIAYLNKQHGKPSEECDGAIQPEMD